MNAGPTELGEYYLNSNIKEAYHQFRTFLYVHSDDDEQIPSRESREMHEKFRELVAQDSGISALMIEHILNSFWALDLQLVEQDAKALREYLAEFEIDEVENSHK